MVLVLLPARQLRWMQPVLLKTWVSLRGLHEAGYYTEIVTQVLHCVTCLIHVDS